MTPDALEDLTDLLESYIASALYPTRTDFSRCYPGDYVRALADSAGRAVLDALLPKKNPGWSESRIRDLVDARELHTRSDLSDASRGAYLAALAIPGLLDDLFGRPQPTGPQRAKTIYKPGPEVSPENLVYYPGELDANRVDLPRFRQLLHGYKETVNPPSRSDFARRHGYWYRQALRDPMALSLLDAALPRIRKAWSPAMIREFVETRGIQTRLGLAKASRGAYTAALATPYLLDEMFGGKARPGRVRAPNKVTPGQIRRALKEARKTNPDALPVDPALCDGTYTIPPGREGREYSPGARPAPAQRQPQAADKGPCPSQGPWEDPLYPDDYDYGWTDDEPYNPAESAPMRPLPPPGAIDWPEPPDDPPPDWL